MKKNKKYIIPILIILIVFILSFCLIWHTEVENISLFKSSSLFTYFAILIGFSITIYTFALSLLGNIKNSIDKLKNLDEEKKNNMFNRLKDGFLQIKQNIWLMFIGIILVVIFSILRMIENPFICDVEKYQIPEIIFLTLFISSTISMYDILKTMFNLSEINIELLRNKSNHKEEN